MHFQRQFIFTLMSAYAVIAVGCGAGQKVNAPDSDSEVASGSSATADTDRQVFRRAKVHPIGNNLPEAPDGDVSPSDPVEDDDDEMTVSGIRGSLDPYDIEDGIRTVAPKFQRCYLKYLGDNHYIGGSIQFAFRVARSGSVKTVFLKESQVGSRAIEQCMLKTAKKIRFARPRGGEAEFVQPMTFEATAPVRWWSEQQTSKEIGRRRLKSLKKCPNGPKDSWITFYIGRRGKVESVGFAGPVALDANWLVCAEQKIVKWVLSDPRGKVVKASIRFAGH